MASHAATPSAARAERIRRLVDLITRASAELAQLMAIDDRVHHRRHLMVVPDDTEPSEANSHLIKRWALRTGRIDRINRGRVSLELRKAYMAAGEPDGL